MNLYHKEGSITTDGFYCINKDFTAGKLVAKTNLQTFKKEELPICKPYCNRHNLNPAGCIILL